jgi:hypothetical protein
VSDDGRHGFDFLFGRWRVHNRKLERPLAGSAQWVEFGTSAQAWPILGGLGNVDAFRRYDAQGEVDWEGTTLRLFDPERRRWSIWWASTSRPGHLEPPVTGAFHEGRGEFLGEDEYLGARITVRYVWSEVTPASARWEQAFSTDGGDTWETNWVMSLSRWVA